MSCENVSRTQFVCVHCKQSHFGEARSPTPGVKPSSCYLIIHYRVSLMTACRGVYPPASPAETLQMRKNCVESANWEHCWWTILNALICANTGGKGLIYVPCPFASRQATLEQQYQLNQREVCLSKACKDSKRLYAVRGSKGHSAAPSTDPEKSL